MTARILPNNEIIVKQYDDEEIKSLSNALGIADETVANYIARQRQDEGIFIVAWKDELPVGSLPEMESTTPRWICNQNSGKVLRH